MNPSLPQRFLRNRPCALAIAALCLVSSVQAATVAWSGLQSTTSNGDIVNAGMVVSAINFGTNGDIPVTVGSDSFTFIQDSVGGISSIGASGQFDSSTTTVASDFDSVLDSFSFFNGSGSTTRTFSGLNAGGTYTVQTFASDDPSTNWVGMIFTIDGVASPAHTTAGSDPNGSGSSPFAIATVTLGPAETSFDLVISSTDTSVVNAVVVAEAIPEPSVVSLLAGAFACVFLRRRR